MKLSFTFSLVLIAICAFAQEKKYDMSNPIEFAATGWNKVLCMKNGNTLLFHLDPTKPVEVKVFDSLHKHIASQEYLCRVMDINALRTSELKGLFEINNEAILFIEQEHLGKWDLVRMRFNGNTGKLTEEKLVGESPGITKRIKYYVMNNRGEDNYDILYSMDEPLFYRCNIHVTAYNGMHESVRDIPIEVDRKHYDSLEVVCAESRPNGVLVSLNLMKMVENRTESTVSPLDAVYDHHLAMYYIPQGSSKVNKQVVDVSTDAYPYYADYTYNFFAKTLNLLVFSYKEVFYKFGIDVRRGSISGNMFFKIAEDNSDIKFSWIQNDSANAMYKRKTDTSKIFYGVPMAMYTNQNGLTTLVTENYERYDEPESGVNGDLAYSRTTRINSVAAMQARNRYEEIGNHGRYDWNSYFGNIAITQFDDDGNEIWGAVLPQEEYFKSYKHYYHPREVAKKNQIHKIFDDLPEQITERQFVSLNSYFHNNDLYIIFNDDNRNFNKIGDLNVDTVFAFENTNACYYKMNRKKEITKNYLFEEPVRNEYKCSFIEGADYDEKRNVYATLVQYKRNDAISLRMAWCHLE